jgi:hypothetical protein
MRKSQSTLLLLVISLCMFAACKKEPQAKPRTELIANDWKVRQVTYVTDDSQDIVYTDPQGTRPNSVNFANYRLRFNTDGTFSRTENNNTQTTGTWRFENNEQDIVFSVGNPGEVTITELAENNLNISYTETSQKTGSREIRIQLVPVQ